MSKYEEGKTFWYVNDFRVKKYNLVAKKHHPHIKGSEILWASDDNNKEGNLFCFDKNKICFTKEEAIEMLNRDVEKLIDQIENDD